MSITALRIASVTQFLRMLLQKGLSDNSITDIVPESDTVSVLAPDKINVVDEEPNKLNLFMYQVTYNQGWRNANQPSVNAKGERISSPPLAIDLHYLLTGYGKEELYADILLGFGMQVFHEIPVLERNVIRNFLTPANLPEKLKSLATSELAEQVEQIKITPELLSIEDISKLWAAFGTKYRTTAAYKATVVLIESNKSTKAGLPVLNRNIFVNPFKQPVIEKILSQKTPNDLVVEDQKIHSGYRLILIGTQLINEKIEIDIDGNPDLKIHKPDIRIEKNGLSFLLPATLKAGNHLVQVIHLSAVGDYISAMSKASTFPLSPAVNVSPVIPPDKVTDAKNLVSATVKLILVPPLYPAQRVVLFMNEITNSEDAKAYSFKMPLLTSLVPPNTTDTIDIKVSKIKKANYFIRVTIDGVESSIDFVGVLPKVDLT